MTGGDIGGLCGFELEAYRQECLRNIFGETFRQKPVKSVHTKSHVRFDEQDAYPSGKAGVGLPCLTSGTCNNRDIVEILSRSSKIKAVGCRTDYGVPQIPPYDIISGRPCQPRRYVGPQYRAYGRRVPVYMLDEDFQEEVMESIEKRGMTADGRLPSPTLVGVAGPQRLRDYQFLSSEHALKPPGSSDMRYSQRAGRNLLDKDGEPIIERRLSRPQTSAQETGWRALDSYPNHFSFGKKTCRETRFAQCITLGARNINGHAGQLAL